jgi:dynein heavy chain 2
LLFLLLAGGEIQWDYIHGLFDQAVYGGRVDNPVDTDVLRSYLMQYFNSAIIGGSRGSRNKLTLNVNIPNSSDLNVCHLKRKQQKIKFFVFYYRNIKRFVRI